MIRDYSEALLEHVATHRIGDSDYYYEVREQDRDPKFGFLSAVERASRILFLNKTCFNGLFRVNSQGQFNVPYGDYKNPVVAEPAIIRAVSQFLNECEVEFLSEDFEIAVREAKKGDFVYFDPPYDPVSDTSSFTGYSLNGFDRSDQVRLKKLCDELSSRGVSVLLSNSSTDFIRNLYDCDPYRVSLVEARRSINSNASLRGKVGEFLISNYAQI